MRLYQLSNLVVGAGINYDSDNKWNEEVVFMAPGGEIHEILSLSWSPEDGKWVLCVDVPDEDSDV